MSGIIEPPKVVTETITITKFNYGLQNLIPHTSVRYDIFCYNGDISVKGFSGVLDGEQYKEWTTDDWMDNFIKQKVEELT